MTEPRWVMVKSCANGIEADMLVSDLEQAGIPAWARTDSHGLFGPGFLGPSPTGVGVMVPQDALDAAREIISGEAGDGERQPGE